MSKFNYQISTRNMPLIHGSQAECLHWFTQLSHLPWSMLLHSAGPTRCDSRFDIITGDPLATLTSNKHDCNIIHRNTAENELRTGQPLNIARQLQAELFGEQAKWPQIEGLPFIGGAMGFLTYDLGRTFEPLPCLAIDDITLPQMAIGFYDWCLIVDKQRQSLTLVQMGGENQLQHRLDWLTSQSVPNALAFNLTSPWQANMDKQGYLQRFTQVQAYLLSGDCYQINLAQRFSASYQGNEWQAYQKLTKNNQTPFSAFIRLDDAAILSVSPERFMQVSPAINSGLKVQTKPIKGTRPRKITEEADQQQITALQNSEKDRAENLMIVDLLRNDISRVCQPSSVVVPELFAIESYCAVHHMVSTIEGLLQTDKNAWDLLEATFPGGSITGAPKIRAMQIIEELEPHRRSLYCGSIFYIGANGLCDSNITIRTLIASNQHLHCWGGGGLVADSVGEDEYQETLDKLAKILPVLDNSLDFCSQKHR